MHVELNISPFGFYLSELIGPLYGEYTYSFQVLRLLITISRNRILSNVFFDTFLKQM